MIQQSNHNKSLVHLKNAFIVEQSLLESYINNHQPSYCPSILEHHWSQVIAPLGIRIARVEDGGWMAMLKKNDG